MIVGFYWQVFGKGIGLHNTHGIVVFLGIVNIGKRLFGPKLGQISTKVAFLSL